MKKILITGASGFVGSHLVPRLIYEKYELLLITRSPKELISRFGSSAIICTLEDENIIADFSPDIIINLAAYSTSSDSPIDQEKMIDANILYLSKLLYIVKKFKGVLFVNTGTFAEFYSNTDELDPAYYYSATKSAGRSILKYFSRNYSFRIAHVIPYSVYGPNDFRKKLIHYLIDSLNSKIPVKTSFGDQKLDFVYIDDLVEMYVKIIEKSQLLPSEIEFKCGTGNSTSVRQIVAILENISGKQANLSWGALPYRNRDIMMAAAHCENALEVLGWKPMVDLRNGLQKLLEEENVL